jgi:Tfp pilus assembly protein FimT
MTLISKTFLAIKSKSKNKNRGMVYVELIIVLSIFATMTGIIISAYDKFLVKIDLKNLANDIALTIIQAQKYALAGKVVVNVVDDTWKPAYGVYFNTDISTIKDNNKNFIYFADLDSNGSYDESSTITCSQQTECIDKISIQGGDSVSKLKIIYQDKTLCESPDLSISFQRPNSIARIKAKDNTCNNSNISKAQITVLSNKYKYMCAIIYVYASGRVQVKSVGGSECE